MVWTKDRRPGIAMSSSRRPAASTICIDEVLQLLKYGLVLGCELDLGQGLLVCLALDRNLS